MDIVFFIEHKDRELGIVQTVAEKLRDDYGLESCVLSLIFHTHHLLRLRPKLVVVPYALNKDDWPLSLVRRLYNNNVQVCAMTWEQMLFRVMEEYKRPQDDIIRNEISHLAWNEGFKDYLLREGVLPEHIYICGSPKAEELSYTEKDKIACTKAVQNYVNLEKFDDILFMPMNYSWAWHTDQQVRAKINRGFPEHIAWDYRKFAQDNLKEFVKFACEIAEKENRAIIIRPHPTIIEKNYIEAFEKHAGHVPDNIFILKSLTVREWVAAAGVIGSSRGTVCYDALQIGKPAFYFTPYTRPEWMNPWWTMSVPNLVSAEEFKDFIIRTQQETKEQPPCPLYSDEVTKVLPKLLATNKPSFHPLKIGALNTKVLLKRFALNKLIHFGVRPNHKPDYFKPIYIRITPDE